MKKHIYFSLVKPRYKKGRKGGFFFSILMLNPVRSLRFLLGISQICFFSLLAMSCNNGEPMDLTENIVGTYDGTVSLYLDTDSIQDFTKQEIEIVRLNDEHIQIIPKIYPSSSPVQGQTFTALLTRTPYGFIRNKGVMLTIESLVLADVIINGTPYLVQGGEREAHGSYNQEKGELVFAFEVDRNGVLEYELFSGVKQ